MKKLFLTSVAILLSAVGSSQEKPIVKKPVHFCGFDKRNEQLKKDPQKAATIEHFEKEIRRFKNDRTNLQKNGPVNAPIIIPIVVTIVHGGVNQPENISDNQVLSQINALNEYYAPAGFKFCLAKKDTNGTVLTGTNPGIQRIQNTALTNLDATTELVQLNPLTPQFPIYKYVNIYVVKTITDPDQSGTIGGVASMYGFAFDGIAVTYNNFGKITDPLCSQCNLSPYGNQGKVLVHEMGHFLGLYHTFNGGCSELDGGNCEGFGDYVCDTPPVYQATSGCPANADTCNEGSSNAPDLVNNYMDYSDQECTNSFTPGQIERMRASLNVTKTELISPENLIQTGIDCIPQLLIASFNALPTFSPCGGTPITLDSQQVPGATYSWDFGDGTTSTDADPLHTYTYAEAPYIATLTVTLNGESISTSKNIYVTDCQPIINEGNTWFFAPKNIVSFSSGTPLAVTPLNNSLDFSRISSAQLTSSGQLQFVTNGVKVWNGSQNIINPSTPLSGNSLFSRTALIIPDPASTSQFYIFTKDTYYDPNNAGLRYSKVTMNGTTPVLSNINTPVNFPADYYAPNGGIQGGMGITAIKSPNGYWLLTNQSKGSVNYISVYSITAAGLAFVSELATPNEGGPISKIVASPDGNWFINIDAGNSKLYRFNKHTGEIITSISLGIYYYDACFSPNSQVLYVVSHNGDVGVFQLDLNAVNIPASKKKVTVAIPGDNEMQLGPDGKIYRLRASRQSLDVIHYPNVLIKTENSNDCHYQPNNTRLNTYVSPYAHLPNLIVAEAKTVFPNTMSYYPSSCFVYNFTANVASGTFSWNFGDSASGANTSTLANPSHTFSGAGTYTVTLTAGSIVITRQIIVGGIQPVIYGGTCAGTNKRSDHFTQPQAGQTIQWSIVSGNGNFTTPTTSTAATVIWTSLPGTIRLTITNAAGCVTTTDKQVIDCDPGAACAPNITFDTPETATNQSYQVSNSIVTQNNYQVTSGSNIKLIAQNLVHIKPESWIKTGSVFLAKIEDCVMPLPNLDTQNPDMLLAKLIVHPNPTEGILNLSGIKINEVYMFDVLGKGVFYSKYNSTENATIDISLFQQGIYFLKVVSTNDTMETIKIIKE